MAKSKFTINENAIKRAAQPQIDEIQDRINETLRATLREVRDEMTGQPADEVLVVIKQRLLERIPGLELNAGNLREYAVAIEKGELEG